MRNVAGQVAGVTSQTTFGSPGARSPALVIGEWEEKSPWAPLAERRAGLKGNAVTSFGDDGDDEHHRHHLAQRRSISSR